jgi:hypothetical protein
MPVLLLPVLLGLVAFLVFRKVSERKAASPKAEASLASATLPPPRKFVL